MKELLAATFVATATHEDALTLVDTSTSLIRPGKTLVKVSVQVLACH